MVNIYTDGSSAANRSGWGWVMPHADGTYDYDNGLEEHATNQRMELTAALKALQFWEKNCFDDDVTIHSDSAYFCNCYFDKWWVNWVDNGWVNSRKEPIANRDIWENLIKFFQNPQVHICKVKGHSGHPYNELADKIATGIVIPAKTHNQLIYDEKNDKINIELSEILLDFQMKKYPVNEVIRRIRKACGCE